MKNEPDLSGPVNLLTSRLKKEYWPEEVMGMYNLRDVRAATPVSAYVPENKNRRLEDSFNLGRVHFFYQELKKGKTLDPVQVDWAWNGFYPDHLILCDGHHRFAAHVLARKKYIPAVCAGPVKEILRLMGR